MSSSKKIEIVAGPNGSGKTTGSSPKGGAAGVLLATICFHSDSIIFKVMHTVRTVENFWALYRTLCKDWYIFDNSNSQPKLILSKDDYETLDGAGQNKFSEKFLSKGKT